MNSFMDSLSQLVLAHQNWSYYIIALATILQGEITILVAIYLVLSGSLKLWLVVLSSFVSILVSDYVLYFIGWKLRNTKFGWSWYKKLKSNKKIQFYSYYISQNLNKIVVLSKFLIGANLITVLMAGWNRVKFGKFLKAHLQAVFVWFLIMIPLAYFLSGSAYALKASKVFKRAELIIAFAFLLFIIGESLFKKFLEKLIGVEVVIKELGKKVKKIETLNEEKILGDDQIQEDNERINRVKSDYLDKVFRIEKEEMENNDKLK